MNFDKEIAKCPSGANDRMMFSDVQIIAAVAAVFSAVAAIASSIVTYVTYRILRKQHYEEKKGINAELLDCYKNNNEEIFWEVTYINTSSRPNAIKIFELKVSYMEKGTNCNVILKPDNKGVDDRHLPTPANLFPRSSISGFLKFRVPPLPAGCHVNGYTLSAEDIGGKKIISECHVISVRQKEDDK